jgi:hypothetical protein
MPIASDDLNGDGITDGTTTDSKSGLSADDISNAILDGTIDPSNLSIRPSDPIDVPIADMPNPAYFRYCNT